MTTELLRKALYALDPLRLGDDRELCDAIRAALAAPPAPVPAQTAPAYASAASNCTAMQMMPAPVPDPWTHCNCLWEGDIQVQQCMLHAAHVDAIREWAERAQAAEAKLSAAPVPVAWRVNMMEGTDEAPRYAYFQLESGFQFDKFARENLYAAPVPQAEPVAWRTAWAVLGRLRTAAMVPPYAGDPQNSNRAPDDLWRTVLLSDLQELLHHATPPTQPAPVPPDCGEAGHAEGRCGTAECLSSARRAQPAPVPVPLTDEQIDKIWDDAHEHIREGVLFRTFVSRAIERAHGIAASPEQAP
jgi:hypothetical protein